MEQYHTLFQIKKTFDLIYFKVMFPIEVGFGNNSISRYLLIALLIFCTQKTSTFFDGVVDLISESGRGIPYPSKKSIGPHAHLSIIFVLFDFLTACFG